VSFLNDLVSVLEDDSVGEWGTDIFTGTRAILPPRTTTLQLIETGGTAPENTQNATAAPAFLQPSAQVVARGTTRVLAEQMAYRAFISLYGIRNRFIGLNWYQKVRPLQQPGDLGLDDNGQIKYGFNVLGKYNRRGDSAPMIDQLLGVFGGDAFSFITPASSDAYPAGATFDKLVPNSWPVLLDSARFPTVGHVFFEGNARVSGAGARAKVALVALDAPDTPIVELTFTADEVIGERKRSTAVSLPASDKLYGVKITCNSTTIGAAAWGCRLVRTT